MRKVGRGRVAEWAARQADRADGYYVSKVRAYHSADCTPAGRRSQVSLYLEIHSGA